MFDPLLDTLNKDIANNGGHQIPLSSYINERFSYKKDSVIRSWLWDVPGFRRWRITRMEAGNKLQVLNSVAYPDFTNELPIMGIDLLWFGHKSKLVAVLDFQPLLQDKYYFDRYLMSLKSLNHRFPEFSKENKMNSYDSNKFFSPWVLFCRGGINHAENILPLVFREFLSSYFELHKQSLELKSRTSPAEVQNLHISYDLYNSERDPAHGLFKSYFGKEWADSFLNEFLFPSISSRDQI